MYYALKCIFNLKGHDDQNFQSAIIKLTSTILPEYSSKIMVDGSDGVSCEETSFSGSVSSGESSSSLLLTVNVIAPVIHKSRMLV